MEQNNPMPYFSSLFTPPSPITSFHQCAMFNNFNLEIVKVFHEQPLTLEFSKLIRMHVKNEPSILANRAPYHRT